MAGNHFKRSIRTIVADWLPPAVVRLAANFTGRSIEWTGDYATWEEACRHADGYEASEILDRVAAATAMVKRGEAVFERDSLAFHHTEFVWPVLAALSWIAARRGGSLDVLDFGGSLGSTYHQHRRFLDSLPEVRWSIVEQAPFVKRGRAEFADDRLRFYSTIEECRRERNPETLLIASVLPYLPDPYRSIDEFIDSDFRFVVVDRTSFNQGRGNRLTVQRVGPPLYRASYPCWFFDEASFRERWARAFDVIAEFDLEDQAIIPSYFKGFILERR